VPQKSTSPLQKPTQQLDIFISEFGRDVGRKLRTREGSPEDHLRGPFERLLRDIARALGLSITAIGETRLPDLSIRPDYAVDVGGARVGYVELKKPGHGVPTTWKKPTQHDKKQWDQFRFLPNVLYSDGQTFARYVFGQRQGKLAALEPGLDQAGNKLHSADGEFARVITDFLLWKPERPRTLDQLVHLIANLCRLLRDDVAAELELEKHGRSASSTFSGLANDWRQVLFPNLSDKAFADQYAQTITFALLLARVDGISFQGRSVGEIARLLGKKHSLMGKALSVLTDQPEDEHSIALATMIRVISAVDWSYFPDDSYAMLYENFLTRYDPVLRRQSGVYYTPAPLVSFMTRFVDEILRDHLNKRLGLAEDDVIIVDPAMGTGSFLASVIDRVAEAVSEDEGPGAVTPRLRHLSSRLIGFENQAAPYAIAELRIHSLLKKRHRAEIPLEERRFLSDTLDDPNVQMLPIGSLYETMKKVRDDANLVKRTEPVMVVIGNPPFVDKVKGSAPWIETAVVAASAAPSIAAFRKPGNGKLEYVLSNKYVYFWRWATWKAFDAHRDHPAGVVALICPGGFTFGPGFAGMREYLRRTTDEGWIIDLSPEGHQPPMNTRAFTGNQQPICVAVFIRRGEMTPDRPAHVSRTAVRGNLNDKFRALTNLSWDNDLWEESMSGWTDPFTTPSDTSWDAMPALVQLMPWTSPGIKPNRTWVYAPSAQTLRDRWNAIISADASDKAAWFIEGRDTSLPLVKPALPGFPQSNQPFSNESGRCPDPIQIGFRSFDRQWLIPDARLIATPRSALWLSYGNSQIFVVEQHSEPTRGGPALTFTDLLPDNHYFMGHHGGRVAPLYRDAAATSPNISPGLLAELSRHLGGVEITAKDLLAYIAAVTSHPYYSSCFVEHLRTPGVRIPLTKNAELWNRATEIGREILWLHSYGTLYADVRAGRPHRTPRLVADPPKVVITIPDDEENMPDRIDYDDASNALLIGAGRIAPVTAAAWNYHVSNMRVVKHWFDYRKKTPSGNRVSFLDGVVASIWTAAMTTELLDLLHVVERCILAQPRQAQLLDDIMAAPQISVDDLHVARVLPVPLAATKGPRASDCDSPLWTTD
jgi:hypothetical protein